MWLVRVFIPICFFVGTIHVYFILLSLAVSIQVVLLSGDSEGTGRLFVRVKRQWMDLPWRLSIGFNALHYYLG